MKVCYFAKFIYNSNAHRRKVFFFSLNSSLYLNYYTSWSTVQIFLICLFEYEILWLENRFNTGKILKSNVKHYLFNFSIMHKFPCHWHNIVKQRSNNSGCITKITKVVEWIAEYNKKITSTSKHCNVFSSRTLYD